MDFYLKLFLLFLLFFSSLIASSKVEVLDNGFIKFSIDAYSTFGKTVGSQGNPDVEYPGMQFDPKGKGNYKPSLDYLNSAGIPFEFFSLKVDSDIYVNDNSSGHKSLKKTKKTKKNSSNILGTLEKKQNKIFTLTKVANVFVIEHKYTLSKNSIYIDIEVKVKNLSNTKRRFLYARGIDTDPGEVETISQRGYGDISARDIIYTIGKKYKLPLALVSRDDITHNTSVLEFGARGLVYDPSYLIRGKYGKFNDDVIYIAFDIGKLEPNQSKTFKFKYLFGNNIKEAVKALNIKTKDTLNYDVSFLPQEEYHLENTKPVTFKMNKIKNATAMLKTEDIPDGIQIKVNDINITNEYKKVNFKKGKFSVSIYKNSQYKESSVKTAYLYFTFKVGEQETIEKLPITITPVPRTLTLKSNQELLEIPFQELNNYPNLTLTLWDNERQITGEEFKQFSFDLKSDHLDYNLEIDKENNQYIFSVEPDALTCLTKAGNYEFSPINVDGVYPNENIQGKINVQILDTDWWTKCKKTIFITLLSLFSMWYIYGLLVKKRFADRKKIIKYHKGKKIGAKILKRQVDIIQKITPYKPETVLVWGMKLIATRDSNTIQLEKKSQKKGMKISGVPLMDPGSYNFDIYTNNEITSSVRKDDVYKFE